MIFLLFSQWRTFELHSTECLLFLGSAKVFDQLRWKQCLYSKENQAKRSYSKVTSFRHWFFVLSLTLFSLGVLRSWALVKELRSLGVKEGDTNPPQLREHQDYDNKTSRAASTSKMIPFRIATWPDDVTCCRNYVIIFKLVLLEFPKMGRALSAPST